MNKPMALRIVCMWCNQYASYGQPCLIRSLLGKVKLFELPVRITKSLTDRDSNYRGFRFVRTFSRDLNISYELHTFESHKFELDRFDCTSGCR